MTIEKDIVNFINYCSKEAGKCEEDTFGLEMYNLINSLDIESPIEQILFCALKMVAKVNYIESTGLFPLEAIKYENNYYHVGFHIFPQEKIGQFRVDFLVGIYRPINGRDEFVNYKKELIVECDSQQFHERTEQERRYEKKRDRFLQSKGYKIFHYTGKEIKDNPTDVAADIIAYLTEYDKKDLLQNSNIVD